jgi:HAD superfamily hydrolase (TIGR01549 family)
VAASGVTARTKAVLFDLDDVLVPFHVPALWQWAWRPQGPVANERRMGSALHRSLRLWDQRRWHGVTGAEPPADLAALEGHLASTLTAIAGHPPPQDESAAIVRRLLHPTGEIARYPDVPPALARLRAAGTRWGVVTPFPRESAEWWLKRSGLTEVAIVAAGDPPGPSVPHPDAFRSAAAHLDVTPGEVTVVGDLLWSDVRAARRAGLGAILLDRSEPASPLGPGRLRTLAELEAALNAPAQQPSESDASEP